MRSRTLWIDRTALTGLVVLGISSLCLGDWPSDPQTNLMIAGDPGEQYSPVSAVDPSGGFYVAWLDLVGGSSALRLKRFESDATESWPSSLVVSTVPFPAYPASIAVGENDHCFLAYNDGLAIQLASITPIGTIDWLVDVSAPLATTFRDPKLTVLDDGSVVVVWESWDFAAGDVGIVGQRVSADGTVLWGSDPLSLDYVAGQSDLRPEIVTTTDQQFVVSWVRDGATSFTPHDLFAQKFDLDGVPQWNGLQPLVIDDGDDVWEVHRLCADGSGGVAIAWLRWSTSEARIQRITEDGFRSFGIDGIVPGATPGLDCALPSLDFLPQDDLVVVWCVGDGVVGGVVAQRFGATGVQQWGNPGTYISWIDEIVETGLRAVACDDGVRVSFSAPPAVGSSDRLLVTQVDELGAHWWTPTAACSVLTPKESVNLLEALDGTSILTWAEERPLSGGLDVFAQNVNGDGTLGPRSVRFLRGECNDDGAYDISDPVALLAYLFIPGTLEPVCFDACDRNDDGALDVTDVVWMLGELFGGTFIPTPVGGCDVDYTPDGLDCASGIACP